MSTELMVGENKLNTLECTQILKEYKSARNQKCTNGQVNWNGSQHEIHHENRLVDWFIMLEWVTKQMD